MVDIDDDSDQRYEMKARRNIRVTHFRFKKMLMNKSGSKMIYDIALLELETAAVLSDKVQLVGLPPANAGLASGTNLLVSGWGDRDSE